MSGSLIAGVAIASIAFMVAKSRRDWKRDVNQLEIKLLGGSYSDAISQEPALASENKIKEEYTHVPQAVQDYFCRVFRSKANIDTNATVDKLDSTLLPFTTCRKIRSFRFQQTGLFNMNGQWHPFLARQVISANPGNIGFVWDATIYSGSKWYNSWIPLVAVCDAWVGNEGYLRAKMFNLVSVASDKSFADHTEKIRQGEMMRWLAEAFIVPTCLLPGERQVRWTHVPGMLSKNTAILQLEGSKEGDLTVTFDTDMIKVSGQRPFQTGKEFPNRKWVGWLSKFCVVDEMLIPTYFEVGWVNPETKEVDLYFKGTNTMMHYVYL